MNKRHETVMKDRKVIYIAAFAAVGIVLLIIGSVFSGGFPRKDSPESIDEYIKKTEKRLCETVSKINGAGKTDVFITLENSFETVYASNASIDESGDETKNARTTQKELAYTTSRTDGETPVVVKQILPKISGILIVCEGGNIPEIRQEVVSSVSIAFNVPSNKIYVTGGNNKK